tara:strand:+ start:118948 stop:119928 length:981 start_codon:yes stop_codon:yes gene_type:complete
MPEYASQPSTLKQLKVFWLSGITFLLLTSHALSQVPVVEAGAANVNTANSTANTNVTNSNDSGNNSGNDIMITLYNMVEALQTEVQTLRGLVEEQNFQIRRMENEQRDRYLDVDGRLSELTRQVNMGSTASGSVSTPAFGTAAQPSALESAAQAALNSGLNDRDNTQVTQPIPTQPLAVNANPQSAQGVNVPLPTENKTEEELYQDARNLLLNDAKYEESITVFQQMIEDYPQGRLAPNAYYWQGEALILVARYSQAINVFNQVINTYPAHEKAPDSMLKLGIVYSLMDNERRAEQVWRELLTKYSESGSASLRLAELYLRDGYNR